MNRRFSYACLCAMALLAACASPVPSTVEAPTPGTWQAALPASAAFERDAVLPHAGSRRELARWWRGQGDALLADLVEAAQEISPSIAAARSRIEQARAARVAAGAALLPDVNGNASISRNSIQPPLPLSTVAQAAVQAAWEIDLFGASRNALAASQARLEGAAAEWHDARVAIAAEVANQYIALRACEMAATIVEADARSRAETSRLTELSAGAGFQAPATAALARASASEARSRAIQQRARCSLDIKALVALSAMPEPELRRRLREHDTDLALPMAVALDAVPARVLAQRPDIFGAERGVAAASADIGSAEAERYPRLSLNGSIGTAAFRAGGITTDFATWSIGPAAVTVPLFDNGRRRAQVEAARARYDEAVSQYRARVRQAVREVEQALVSLQASGERLADARAAVDGYRAAFAAIEARYTNGFASLIELEDVRRTRLAAETALVSLQQERVAASIALYRAAGGNWDGALATDALPASTLQKTKADQP